MTASTVPIQQLRPASSGQPPARRLGGAAVVGGMGMIAFSIAVGSYVAAARSAFIAGAAGPAQSLQAAVPWLVLIGFAHLAVAVAILRGSDLVRVGAVVVIGLAAIAAAAATVMTAVGVDPFGPTIAGPALPTGGGLLVAAAIGYGVAAALVGIAPTED